MKNSQQKWSSVFKKWYQNISIYPIGVFTFIVFLLFLFLGKEHEKEINSRYKQHENTVVTQKEYIQSIEPVHLKNIEQITSNETFAANTLVIPMDNNYQNLGNTSSFNLKAYGLVVTLLHADIPVKWIIKPGKSKDGIDFSASTALVAPTSGSSANRNFKAGPFIVQPGFETQAMSVINSFNAGLSGNEKVNVYQLSQTANNVPVKHTLVHKPKGAILNNGGNDDIHEDMYNHAGLTENVHFEKGMVAANITNNSCFTFISEPHADENEVASSEVNAVRSFVQNGGNFLAQCAAGRAYENLSNSNKLVTQSGVTDPGIGGNIQYTNSDETFAQTDGVLADEGGSAESYKPAGFFRPGMDIKSIAFDSNDNDNYKAYGGKADGVTTNKGGYVFYLAGHDYNSNGIGYDNGYRMFLNAFLTPADRPQSCGLTLCNNTPSSINVSKNNPSSCGLFDGSITVSVSGSTPPFEYSIDNGLNWQNSANFTGLTDGVYIVKVRTSSDGCEYPYPNNPVVLQASNSPIINSVVTNSPSICGAADGTITVSATAASLPIEYSIDNGQTWQSTGNFTGLNDGVYMIVVRNTNGTCAIEYSSNPVILNSNTGPIITNTASTNPSACGANDGTITITAILPNLNVNCNCSDKMKELTIRYNGTSNTTLKVLNKSQSQLETINVTPNQVLVLKSSDYGLSDWDTKFFLEYNGTDYEFHTSCSDDLAEMNAAVNPQFTVLSYVDGSGNFCNQSASSCDCNDKMKEITTVFKGNNNATLKILNKSSSQIGTLTNINTNDVLVLKSSDYGLSDWDTKFFLQYNGTNYEFHTSCSDDIDEMNVTVAPIFEITGFVDGPGDVCNTTPPVEYSIDGTNYQSSNQFTGLAAGTYNAYVRYTDGTCPFIYYGIVLTGLTCPEICNNGIDDDGDGLIDCADADCGIVTTVTPSDETCSQNNGTIAFTFPDNPNQTGIEFSINGGGNWNYSTNDNAGSFTITGLSAGNYNVRARWSDNSCPIVVNNSVVINNQNDPIACNPSILFQKSTDVDTAIMNGTVIFTFTIFNNAGATLNNITFTDMLSGGGTFFSEPFSATNGMQVVGNTNGLSTANLTLNNVRTGISSFQLAVNIPSGLPQWTAYCNQASISNLQASNPNLPASMNSDDPSTTPIGDPTCVLVKLYENCCNGIDDDGDGKDDCDDTDCND